MQVGQGSWKRTAIIAAVVVVILALIAWGIQSLLSGKSDKPRKAPKISLLAPPPPPPPPPPKEEKKPEPPKEQKEMKVAQPLENKQAPPPSPDLKMEGAAGDGPSAFGAGKITSEDLSKLGAPSGDGNGLFNPFNSYAGTLKNELQRYLNKTSSLRQRQYRIEIQVWVSGDGSLKRSELIGTTGDSDTDNAIRQAMTTLSSFNSSPPANMPQPIRLRVVTSGRS